MTSLPDDKVISEFWHWFSQNAESLEKLDGYSPFWAELQTKLGMIEVEHWEIGPHGEENRFFALSANGSRASLERNRLIVRKAPQLPGWIFLASKPSKAHAWHRQFEWGGDAISIDASGWRFAIRPRPDRTWHFTLIGGQIPEGLSHKVKTDIIEFVIESELGEEAYLELVSGVGYEEELPSADQTEVTPIEQLHLIAVGDRPEN